MNQRQLNDYRWRVSKLVTKMIIKWNVIHLNTHNSKQHEKIKFEICYDLQKQGKSYITEAPLIRNKRSIPNKGIADILVLDDCRVIEIMFSETLDELKWKVRKFPIQLEIIAVRSYEDWLKEKYEVIRNG